MKHRMIDFGASFLKLVRVVLNGWELSWLSLGQYWYICKRIRVRHLLNVPKHGLEYCWKNALSRFEELLMHLMYLLIIVIHCAKTPRSYISHHIHFLSHSFSFALLYRFFVFLIINVQLFQYQSSLNRWQWKSKSAYSISSFSTWLWMFMHL